MPRDPNDFNDALVGCREDVLRLRPAVVHAHSKPVLGKAVPTP